MTISELDQALSINAGTLTLGATTLPAAGLDSLLRVYNGSQPVQIAAASKNPVGDSQIVIKGGTSWMNCAGLEVEASFTVDAAAPTNPPVVQLRFKLIGDVPSPTTAWKFSTSFPKLPTSPNFSQSLKAPQTSILDDLALSNAWMVLTNVKGTDPGTAAPLEPGLNFVASLTPTGALGIFASSLDASKDLVLHGTITMPPESGMATPPLASDTYSWESSTPPPGIQLQAALGIQADIQGLKLDDTVLRLYSPLTQDWWKANVSYGPTQAVTGTLDIVSADIQVVVTALILKGYSLAIVSGRFTGVSVGNLARLSGLSNGGDLAASLPDGVTKLLGTLSDLSLEAAAIGFGGSLDASTVAFTSMTVGMPNTTWTLIDGVLDLKEPALDFMVNQPFDSGARSLSTLVRGDIDFCGATIHATTMFPGFAVRAELAEDTTLSLRQVFATHLPSLPTPPDLTINRLVVAAEPGKSYSLYAGMAEDNPWTLDLGPVSMAISGLELQLTKTAGDSGRGSFFGVIEFNESLRLAMSYETPGSFMIRADCPTASLSQMVSRLANQQVSLPDGFDLTFQNSSVLIQKAGDDLVFQLGTTIQSFGTLAFEARKVAGGQWGFAAGLSMNPGAVLSQISGLGGVGDLLQLFALDKLLLVVSSFDDPGFTFPDLAAFNNPSITAGGLTLPQSGGIIAGLNVYAHWSFDNSQQQQFLKKFLGIDKASLGIVLQIGENPSQNAKLFASMAVKVAGLNLQAEFGGLIRNGRPGLFLQGSLVAPIQGHDYTFTVTLLFVANGAFLSGTMQGATAIDLEVFKLSNVALAVGIDWEGIPSLGIAGTIDVSSYESSLAVFFNSSDPSQSLVAGSVSDLTLKDILDTLTGNAIPSEIDEVLHQVGVGGTQTFQLAGSLADDLDNLRMDKISAAFATQGVVVPSSSAKVLLVVNTRGSVWYLTDLTHEMRHYQIKLEAGVIKVSVEAQLYLAPQDTAIGELSYKQGFFINGAINVFTLSATATVDVSRNKGIAVDAQMNKIVIGSEALFSIMAAQGDGGPKISASTFQQDNNPVAEFRPPHFYVNGQMEMLGLKKEIFASLTKDGFEFDINGDLVPSLNFDLHGHFNSLSDMGVGGALKIAIGSIDLGPLGKISINTGVAGALDLSVKGSTIKVDLDASFMFAGTLYKLATLHLDASTSFFQYADTVWQKVKDFLKDLFLDAVKWAKAVADGFIEGVEDASKVLVEVYHKTEEEARSILGTVSSVCGLTSALHAM